MASRQPPLPGLGGWLRHGRVQRGDEPPGAKTLRMADRRPLALPRRLMAATTAAAPAPVTKSSTSPCSQTAPNAPTPPPNSRRSSIGRTTLRKPSCWGSSTTRERGLHRHQMFSPRWRVLKLRCFGFSSQRGSRKLAQGKRPAGTPPWVGIVTDFEVLKGRPYVNSMSSAAPSGLNIRLIPPTPGVALGWLNSLLKKGIEA